MQIKPMFDSYKNISEDIMDSNINNRVFDKSNLPQLSKPSEFAFWLKKAISLLFELLNKDIKVISSKNNNSRTFLLSNLSYKLPLSIVLNNPLNLFLKPDNYRLCKRKKGDIFTF